MKHCTACKHFNFDGGAQGYSELTPGSDASMSCSKKGWGHRSAFNIHDFTDQADLYETLRTAEACEHFELADYAKPKVQA